MDPLAPLACDIMISGTAGRERYEFPLRLKAIVSYATGRVLSYGMRLGGHVHSSDDKDVCVFLDINAPPAPPEPEDESLPCYEASDGHRVGNIVQVRYDECCATGMHSMHSALHKGGGTAAMLQAACAYAVRVFPWVESFSLTDTSYVTAASGLQVPLGSLCICTSGATWHEREFGARLRDAVAHRQYRRLVASQLQTPGAKPGSIAELCSRARVQCPDADACLQMEACYAGASTLQAFFCALKASRSRDEYRELVWPWVDNLLDKLLDGLHHKEWLVPADSFKAKDIQVGSSRTGAHQGCWAMPPQCATGDMFHPTEDI